MTALLRAPLSAVEARVPAPRLGTTLPLPFAGDVVPGRARPAGAPSHLADRPAWAGRARVAGRSAAPEAADAEIDAPSSAAVGERIGRDHARAGLTPPLHHLHPASPVRCGWQAARASAPRPASRASAALATTLRWRLDAWQQGVPFETFGVTPAFVARLGRSTHCVVTRQPLGTVLAATPMRLNAAAAVALGNVVAVSPAVVDARAEAGGATPMGFEALRDLARRLQAEPDATAPRGLDASAWARLATLVSFATPLPHAVAAALPLVVLPPARVHVVNPAQALQVALTLQFTAPGWGRRIAAWSQAMPDAETRQTFQIFMHTLLARRLEVAADATPQALREALEDAWRAPLLLQRWQRLALRLDAARVERLLRHAAARGWLVGGARWLPEDAAVDGWSLRAAA